MAKFSNKNKDLELELRMDTATLAMPKNCKDLDQLIGYLVQGVS